ncbi:hypothetical protein FB451DRAFT_1248571, partial [Mycena latifolia]
MTSLAIRVFILASKPTLYSCVPPDIHSDDRRCEVLLRKEIPTQAQTNKTVMSVGYDMKHTQHWDCEICGSPARESWIDPRPSLRLTEPLVVLHIHLLCEAGGGPCHTAVETRARELAIESGGMLPPPSVHLPKPPGPPIPLAGSCAKCQRDETGSPGFAIRRCSKCKLT